ncbi:phage tail protein [Mycoplana ramosa]|uniref:Phage tail protein n=1 Tax=Mycoplana ramosa TaxID=40837 RepID=A0ABW3Z324_MYCRA
MRLKALITLLLFLISAAPAAAAPLAAAAAWAGSIISASGAAAVLIKAALTIAINVGLGLLEQARARKAARKQQRGGVTLSIQVGDTIPRSYLLGTRATAGRRVYIGSWGKAGKTPNAYVTDVIELSCLPSNAGPHGLNAVWIGDKKCKVLWDQPHEDGRGYPVEEYREDGKDYLWVKYLDGSQTAVDPFLLTTFQDDSDRPFKSTMIGRGCQVVILTARYNQDLFPQGLPQGLYQPEPMRVYDLREDSTNGGSGSQRWNSPSTWAPSDNLAVLIYNVIRGIYYDGRWVHGGRNFAAHRLPASAWIAAANEADRRLSGRKQFRGGLEVFVDEEGLDTIEDLRLGCAGRLAEVGGMIKLLVGAPAAAVYSFTDEEIVVSSDQDYQPFPSVSGTHNTIAAVYPEPKQRWADKDAPERSLPSLVARDGGQKLSIPVRFDAVPFFEQIQSLTKTMLDEEQRWRVHEFVLPPSAAALEPNDVVAWSSERNFYSNKKFLVCRVVRLRGCLQRIQLKEIDPSDYDPPDIILPPVTGWLGPRPLQPQQMTGWMAEPAVIKDADGVSRRAAIRIGCDTDLDDVARVRVQVRLKASGDLVFDSDSRTYDEPYAWLLSGSWCLPVTAFLVRGKYIPQTRRKTAWSGWIDVTTADVRFSERDIYTDGMLEDIQDFVEDATDWLREGSRDLIDEVHAIARLVIEQDTQNYTDKKEMQRELVSKTDQITASYKEAIVAATGPGSALVQRMETAEINIGKRATVSAVDALTLRTKATEDGLTSFSGQLTEFKTELGKKASASALNALTNTVTQQGDKITLQGTSITSIRNDLKGKASTESVSVLDGRIDTIDGQIKAVSDALISVTAASGGKVAAANFRMRSSAGPTGFAARIGLEARAGGAGAWRAAGIYLDVPENTTKPTRVVIRADQFVVTDASGTVKNPFVFSGGEARLNVANIGTVNSGQINSLNGKMKINLNAGTITIYN